MAPLNIITIGSATSETFTSGNASVAVITITDYIVIITVETTVGAILNAERRQGVRSRRSGPRLAEILKGLSQEVRFGFFIK